MPDADTATWRLPSHMVLMELLDLGMDISWILSRPGLTTATSFTVSCTQEEMVIMTLDMSVTQC